MHFHIESVHLNRVRDSFFNNLLLDTIRFDQNYGIVLKDYLFYNCSRVTKLAHLSYLSELSRNVFGSLRNLPLAFVQITSLQVGLFRTTSNLKA